MRDDIYDKLTANLIETAKNTPNIRLVGLGEYKGFLSDIDIFICVNRIECIQEAIEYVNILNKILGEPIGIAPRGFLSGYGYGIQIIYESGIRIDMNINGLNTIDKPFNWLERKIVYCNWEGLDAFLKDDEMIYLSEMYVENTRFWIEFIKAKKAVFEKNYLRSLKYYVRMQEAWLVTAALMEHRSPMLGSIYRSDINKELQMYIREKKICEIDDCIEYLASTYCKVVCKRFPKMKKAYLVALHVINRRIEADSDE